MLLQVVAVVFFIHSSEQGKLGYAL